ncbi:hypothetical protein BN85407450 [Alteracholeplasma palmae J233]|uniref:Uncharacterized protein n=1 Tax=Alteracholeplasma palmae (strain ATCC 49389 / J233) TaxID=1318466 RepID=U4KKU6_ALTPJ|nr:hypothetical protein [Alteracholeplasma palmae]CCV64322.1 hypothetical protein BN85407450 [Alteracholeplasma palmae J233]
MNKDAKKLAVIKEALDKRLRELYKEARTEICKEAQTLEYIMCLVEADPDNEEYATSCLIKMYG